MRPPMTRSRESGALTEGSNAPVSPTLANWPRALWYVFTAPVTVSVTVRSNSTDVSAPKKTQYFWLIERASRTLMTSSMLVSEKNQK